MDVERNKIVKYAEERDEMLLKRDVNAFREFVRTHREYFPAHYVITMEKARDEVLEIAIHKMIVNSTNLPLDFCEESVEWLLERGYSLDF
jgi:hypothetical protein